MILGSSKSLVEHSFFFEATDKLPWKLGRLIWLARASHSKRLKLITAAIFLIDTLGEKVRRSQELP